MEVYPTRFYGPIDPNRRFCLLVPMNIANLKKLTLTLMKLARLKIVTDASWFLGGLILMELMRKP